MHSSWGSEETETERAQQLPLSSNAGGGAREVRIFDSGFKVKGHAPRVYVRGPQDMMSATGERGSWKSNKRGGVNFILQISSKCGQGGSKNPKILWTSSMDVSESLWPESAQRRPILSD